MKELFRIPRIAAPALTRRTISLAVAGVIVAGAVITPGLSLAAKAFTLQKAQKASLGNTSIVTVQGTATPEVATPTTVLCPPGLQATNGGADSPALGNLSGASFPWLLISVPVSSGGRSVGWYVEVYNSQDPPQQYTAYAVCAP
jgi:hypothetical protein